MPNWDSAQYLRFGDERTRPCRELAARVAIEGPARIIDLGCGPGNSTTVLAERWPSADITGVDSSAEMIRAARASNPARRWVVGDIADWVASEDDQFDVVFSNASLQWVADHPRLFPQLMRRVAAGGALAVQMPGNYAAPPHQIMRELARSTKWRSRFPADGVREWHVHDLTFYFDALAPHAARLDLWETEYLHILPSAEAIVDWYKGTGLRPFLQALPSDEDRAAFTSDYLERIREAFIPRPDGRVLFPFRRLFIIAYVRSSRVY